MGTIKISILEKDGEEFFNPTEMDLTSALSHVGASALPNFSYRIIPENTVIEIPIEQQMIVKGRMKVLGNLKLKGELCLI